MKARILDKSEEGKWADFVAAHPLATIHQSPKWGHFQAKVPARGKYWIVVLEDEGTDGKSPFVSDHSQEGVANDTTLHMKSTAPGANDTTQLKADFGNGLRAEPIKSNSKVKIIGGHDAGHGPSPTAHIIGGHDTGHGHGPTAHIIGGTMLIRHSLPKGYCWFYAARGPLLDYAAPNLQEYMDALLECIRQLAKKEKAVFLRIDPPIMTGTTNTQLSPTSAITHSDTLTKSASTQLSHHAPLAQNYPKLSGFSPTHHGFQPQHTLILDLTKSEEEILTQMKPKGRYNIRLAEKKGVKIRVSNPLDKTQFSKDIAAFYSILKETTSRDGFHGHDKDFYANMVRELSSAYADKVASQSSGSTTNRQSALAADSVMAKSTIATHPAAPLASPSATTVETNTAPLANLYIAEYEGQIIAATIVTFFASTATYYYGVSSDAHRNVMAPYLLQWQAIKDAKARGLTYYDFLGIAPESATHHPWAGVTEFKKKFGGHEFSYAPAQELSFRKLIHAVYKMHKK